MARKNAFYAQSGGVTAVINTSAAASSRPRASTASTIGKVYAGRDGIIGALTEDLIDTGKESPAAIRALRHTPGGAFGSCRYKLKGLEENRAQYERLIEVFKAHDIGYFFYNGGNDSADTCLKVSQYRRAAGLSARLHACRRPWTTTCRSPTAARASARSRSTSPPACAKRATTWSRWRGPRPRSSSWR